MEGQVIKGYISDASTNEPIEFGSIGILHTYCGTLTNEQGYFELESVNIDSLAKLRVSMIGYEQIEYKIADVLNRELSISLKRKIYDIREVNILPGKERLVGQKGYNPVQGWSGWRGTKSRKGHELGFKANLGDNPVKIISLHVRLHRQAFDTSYFRLHIRAANDTLILDELLNENIYLVITSEKGWVAIDLEQYNLVFSGRVALTLEWLKVAGLNPERKMYINGEMQDDYILLKNKKNQTGLYRRGTEANWQINEKHSPAMYLNILE